MLEEHAIAVFLYFVYGHTIQDQSAAGEVKYEVGFQFSASPRPHDSHTFFRSPECSYISLEIIIIF